MICMVCVIFMFIGWVKINITGLFFLNYRSRIFYIVEFLPFSDGLFIDIYLYFKIVIYYDFIVNALVLCPRVNFKMIRLL